MNRLFLTICFIFISYAHASAQNIYCPETAVGLTFSAPKEVTDKSGKTRVVCRYYDRRHVKGTVTVYFHQEFMKQKKCSERVYKDADVRSWTYQAYGFFTDENAYDELTDDFWLKLLEDLVRQAEEKALPCDMERRMIDIRQLK